MILTLEIRNDAVKNQLQNVCPVRNYIDKQIRIPNTIPLLRHKCTEIFECFMIKLQHNKTIKYASYEKFQKNECCVHRYPQLQLP